MTHTTLHWSAPVNVTAINGRCAPYATLRYDHLVGLRCVVCSCCCPNMCQARKMVQLNTIIYEGAKVRHRLPSNDPVSMKPTWGHGKGQNVGLVSTYCLAPCKQCKAWQAYIISQSREAGLDLLGKYLTLNADDPRQVGCLILRMKAPGCTPYISLLISVTPASI